MHPRTSVKIVRTILLAALLALAAVAIPPAAASHCVPAQDEGARWLLTPLGTYYARLYPNQGYQVLEIWEENNGESGLQYSVGMSCAGAPDKLVFSRCVGFCPIQI